MSQSYHVYKLICDVPTVAEYTEPNLCGPSSAVISNDGTVWLIHNGNNMITPIVSHYDSENQQLLEQLSFVSAEAGLTRPQKELISDLLWLQKNVLAADQGIIFNIPYIYDTAPLLGTADDQPSSSEISLDAFLNAPNGYLGSDVDISFLINYCINNPTISPNQQFDDYLRDAHKIYIQLLVDLHDDSLIFEYGDTLLNAQAELSQTSTHISSSQIVPSSSGYAFNPLLPMVIVYNSTQGFVKERGLPDTTSADMIAASSEGKIYTYHALSINKGFNLVIDNRLNYSVYTGMTLTHNNIYLADLANSHIRVYDSNLVDVRQLNERFLDPDLPINYSPFNVVTIDQNIYVLYAKLDTTDVINVCNVVAGRGLGIINVFTPDGLFVQRAVTHGPLNAPWGLILHNDQFLVTNHGNGHVEIYDRQWKYVGRFRFKGHDRSILPVHDRHSLYGLYGLLFLNDHLYFSSRPTDQHGLLGYLYVKNLQAK